MQVARWAAGPGWNRKILLRIYFIIYHEPNMVLTIIQSRRWTSLRLQKVCVSCQTELNSIRAIYHIAKLAEIE